MNNSLRIVQWVVRLGEYVSEMEISMVTLIRVVRWLYFQAIISVIVYRCQLARACGMQEMFFGYVPTNHPVLNDRLRKKGFSTPHYSSGNCGALFTINNTIYPPLR